MSPRADKRRLGVSQRRGSATQSHRQASDLADPSLDQELLRTLTWLTVPQVVAYLQFPSPAAVREWASRNGIRKGRRGRTLVFKRAHLDEAVQPSVKR